MQPGGQLPFTALWFRRPIANLLAYISNPFGNYYQIRPGVWNYHSSIDIVFQQGNIMGCPIQSVSWGEVIYAARVTAPGYTVFGNLIVVKTTLPDGSIVYCRYAHHANMRVKSGDIIYPGQHIADVSDAFGQYAPHLDFAISPTDVLAITPWDWPGTDLARVYRDYVDPCSFIRKHQMEPNFDSLRAAMANISAAVVNTNAAILDANAIIDELDTTEPPPPPPAYTVMYVISTTGVNVRSSCSTANSMNIVTGLTYRTEVHVKEAAVSGWVELVEAVGRAGAGNFIYGANLSTTRPT